MSAELPAPHHPPPRQGNRYGRMEWAGAFGDLGTLLPFVIGFIAVTRLDPMGVLFSFGLSMVVMGLYFRTPVPVQPMKVIGGVAITQAGAVTPGMIWGAGIFTGALWLVLSLTDTLKYVSRLATRPVICGISLGLGLSFMRNGIQMMGNNWPIAIAALLITFLLLKSRRFPAMFVLLIFGLAVSLATSPGFLSQLMQVQVGFKLPDMSLFRFSWNELVMGTLMLGIPQAPLTLGNAVVALAAENNRLFPDRPVTERRVAATQGLMNLLAPFFGGVPMCHGVGGMAGHVRFGAQTGGALVIIGGVLLVLALFFSSSVDVIFKVFPTAVVGVILFFAGIEVASAAATVSRDKPDFYVMLMTAGFGMWNMGAGFLAGVVLQILINRKWVQV